MRAVPGQCSVKHLWTSQCLDVVFAGLPWNSHGAQHLSFQKLCTERQLVPQSALVESRERGCHTVTCAAARAEGEALARREQSR